VNILGINAYHCDASAALVVGGERGRRRGRALHPHEARHLVPPPLDPLLPEDGWPRAAGIDDFGLSRNPRANLGRRVLHSLGNRAGRQVAAKRPSNGDDSSVEPAETRFVRTSDGISIASQVVGNGPVDLVWIPGYLSDAEFAWTRPPLARLFQRIAS
jgi:hypothetical protein